MSQQRTVQTLHDRVVKAIAAQAAGHVAYTNLDGHLSACLVNGPQEAWPDVILCDQETILARHVIEVETLETLTPTQAERWARTAAAVREPAKFWLLVPAVGHQRALSLCQQYGVRAHVGVWSLGAPSGVTVTWHPVRAQRVAAHS